ncbi:MAG: hypothetical protein HY906_25625 [Deltaproteobacteria bacterium]|nr:hypothetical protein [Deltaproteobacteria bacterium]
MLSRHYRTGDAPWLRAAAAFVAVALLAAPAAVGCGGDEEPVPPMPPREPDKGDSPEAQGYQVGGLRAWYLIGNSVTSGTDTLEVAVMPTTAKPRYIYLWLDRGTPVKLTKRGGTFRAAVDIATIAPGAHEVLLAANGATKAFAQLTFQRSHPFYVVVSNDWDDPDSPDANLARQQALHDRHADLKITHFFGPYTFTDPAVAPTRATYLADLVKTMRDTYDDEIGLHIHPWCSFVEQAGLACRTSPSFGYANGDDTGYTVVLAEYSEEEMATMLAEADSIFIAHGLGKPLTFRAGGWTSQIHTLKALHAAGFVVDASGCNWSRLEAWQNVPGASLYAWNQANWATIDDLSQPYYPNVTDILTSVAPQVGILEAPDNGILADYVTTDEMVEIFQKNWDGTALTEPRALSVGYHPVSFGNPYYTNLDGALTHFDQHLASADAGPVSYATMSQLPFVWQPAR